MRSVMYFLVIVFLEMTCGFILSFVYWIIATLAFDKDGFGRSMINEVIYYTVTLVPPFVYCLMEHSRFQQEGNKKSSVIYLWAGLAYLVGGLVFMLSLTNFYIVR